LLHKNNDLSNYIIFAIVIMDIKKIMTQTKILGQEGEKIAARYLSKQGYQIIERNFRTRFGEIDLIARKGKLLVFVEVKTRIGNEDFGQAEWAITKRKINQVRKMAEVYLVKNRPDYQDLRIDAITIIISPEGKIISPKHWKNLTAEI